VATVPAATAAADSSNAAKQAMASARARLKARGSLMPSSTAAAPGATQLLSGAASAGAAGGAAAGSRPNTRASSARLRQARQSVLLAPTPVEAPQPAADGPVARSRPSLAGFSSRPSLGGAMGPPPVSEAAGPTFREYLDMCPPTPAPVPPTLAEEDECGAETPADAEGAAGASPSLIELDDIDD